ncbi:hypothetical protein C8Q74DRAFT_322668 [Fomes fomentarius]|nr:hypothetical protein C8Q74DRAFT_322668 [Fomes fomentarius]
MFQLLLSIVTDNDATQSPERSTQYRTNISPSQQIGLPRRMLQSYQAPNAPPHIDKLPTELLVIIFKFCHPVAHHQGVVQLDSWGSGNPVETSTILTITHVSSLWRCVALSCDELWTHVDGECYARLTAFLDRSQQRPLWLSLDTDTSHFMHVLSTHRLRIRRLDFTVHHGDDDAFPLLSVHLPSLECFTLSYFNIPQRTSALPPTVLFGDNVSQLKALAVLYMGDWWPTNRFTHLTHLHLALDFRTDDPTPEKFLGLLSRTPMLEHLHVLGMTGPGTPTNPRRSQVDLSRLRSVVFVHSELAEVLMVLIYLIFPRNIFIRFGDMTVSSLLPKLPSLSVLPDATSMEIATTKEFLHFAAEGSSSAFGLDCEIQKDTAGSEDWVPWLNTVILATPLSQVTTLQLYLGDCPHLLSSLLSAMVGLTDLDVCFGRDYETADDGFTVVSPALQLYKILAAPVPLVCTQLRSFTVYIPAAGYPTPVVPWLHAGDIVHMLRTRRCTGYPLHRMVLKLSADVVQIVKDELLAQVEMQFGGLERPSELAVCCPGRAESPFKERECWNVDGADEYWLLNAVDKPLHTVPWNG